VLNIGLMPTSDPSVLLNESLHNLNAI